MRKLRENWSYIVIPILFVAILVQYSLMNRWDILPAGLSLWVVASYFFLKANGKVGYRDE